ncbi:hypothetical protein [Singulisphaera sp. PoT]|uniref:hypothetical protein n=1 Tax=Singulisphaera sp. PoT TaxID=3411797 RepID=UPI003BF60B04
MVAEFESAAERADDLTRQDTKAGRKIPFGFLGMLALIVAGELLVGSHRMEFSDPVSWNWRLSAEDAVERAPEASILCVGDSLVKHSVIPSILEDRTGLKTYNLGLARGPAPATYFMLKRALDAGARPKAVVIEYKPGVLVGSPRYNLRYWQEILTLQECLELTKVDGGGSLFTEIAIGRLLPSYRSRHEIRGALHAAFRGEANPLRLINQFCLRNWRLHQGANVAARNPAFNGTVGPEQQKTLLWHLSYCHRTNRAYIGKLLNLTARRGIPTYWLLPPLSPDLQGKREASKAEEGYLKLVRSFQERYPHLKVVDSRHAGYGHEVFVDATHLDGQGATTLSEDLGTYLAQDLKAKSSEGSRWASLPSYRKISPSRPLEDVDQSQEIVRAQLAEDTRRR